MFLKRIFLWTSINVWKNINIDCSQSNDAGRRTSSAPSPTAKTPATRAEQTHGPGKQVWTFFEKIRLKNETLDLILFLMK